MILFNLEIYDLSIIVSVADFGKLNFLSDFLMRLCLLQFFNRVSCQHPERSAFRDVKKRRRRQ